MARYFLALFFIAFLLSGCGRSSPPAPVVNMGLKGNSTGVINVMPGDTLWSLSDRYRISMQDIIAENYLSPPFILDVGDRLKLPAPREYKVRAGDSLYTISRLYDTDTKTLARLNNMKSPYTLHTGDTLRLPGQNAAPVSTKTPGRPPVRTSSAQKPPQKIMQSRTPPARASSRFLSPVQGKILSGYGPKAGGLHNDGINIAAPRGTSVKAADNGIVVYVGSELEGFGNLVLVKHADRWMTAYGHLDSVSVKRGATVKRGDVIAKVGSTGAVDTPQLHFEVRKGTKALDPQKYL